MSNHKAELTFGVELELVEFYNGEPINAIVDSELKNSEFPDEYCWGEVSLVREKTDMGNWVERFYKAEWINTEDGEPQEIELDSDGNPLPPWSIHRTSIDAPSVSMDDIEDTAIDQAKKILINNGLKDWDVEWDDSLTHAATTGIELVSPIYQSGDFSEIQKVCKIFAGIAEPDRTCGLHVHIGIVNNNFEYEYLKRFARIWFEAEPEIYKVPIYKDWAGLARSAQPLRWHTDLKQIHYTSNKKELMDTINPCEREHPINLKALEKYGTIEFRGFKGTLNSDWIHEAVMLCESKIRKAII